MQLVVRFFLFVIFITDVSLTWAESPSQEPASQARMAIFFDADNPSDTWIAKTFQESIKSYIASFSNLSQEDLSEQFLKCTDLECRMKILKEQGTSYFWSGTYTGSRVRYRIIDVPTEATIQAGWLAIVNWRGQDLQLQTLQIVKPIVRSGGLIDLKKEEQKHIQRIELTEKLQGFFDKTLMTKFGWLVALFGGCAWAFIVLKLSQFCFGNFYGIHRINHSALFIYLQAWLEVFLGKLILVLLIFAPPLVAAQAVFVPHLFSQSFFNMVVSPIIMILIFGYLYLLNTSLTQILDRLHLKKVKENPWHDKIEKYFLGYKRRLGIDLPESVLSSIQFFVTDTDRVMTYGGFGRKIRLVLPIWIVEPALGALPVYKVRRDAEEKSPFNEERSPQRELEVRSLISAKALRSDLKNRSSEDVYDLLAKDFYRKPGEISPEDARSVTPPFASQAGVWGFVLPHKKHESVPLISDNLQDLEVVEDLINEHHIHFARPQISEEFDDSDPNQKDYLFALLMQQIGHVHRHETPLMTLNLFLYAIISKLPKPLLTPFNWLEELYDRNYSRFPAFISDAYVALNHGAHHLVQYLYFLGTQKKQMMTSRAGRKGLSQRSNEILNWVAQQEPSARDLNRNRATLRNRFFWAASFFQVEFKNQQFGKRIKWKRFLALFSLLGAASIEVYAAIQFHPIYLERMENMHQKVKEFEEDEMDRKEGRPPRNRMKAEAPSPLSVTTEQRPAENKAAKEEKKVAKSEKKKDSKKQTKNNTKKQKPKKGGRDDKR